MQQPENWADHFGSVAKVPLDSYFSLIRSSISGINMQI